MRAGVGEEDEGHGWLEKIWCVCVCVVGGWREAWMITVLGVSSDGRVGSGWNCGGEGGDDFVAG